MGTGMLAGMELSGLYVPLVTPFTEDGELAPDALETLAHDVIEAGASGLVPRATRPDAPAWSPSGPPGSPPRSPPPNSAPSWTSARGCAVTAAPR